MADQIAPTTSTTTADVANAKNRNLSLSQIAGALSGSSSSVVAGIDAVTAAVTASIIGGTTGANANRALVSKGTAGRALQPTVVSIDPATGVITGASWQGGVISPVFGGTGIANNAASTLTISGNFASTFTVTGITGVTFPTSGTLATLNTNVWVQQQGFTRVSLTDASTITWNAQTQQSAYVLLTAAVGSTRVLGAPSNQISGFTYILMVQQSSAGGNALTYNSVYKWPAGVAPVLSTAANAIDILTFVSNGTNMYGVAQKAFA